MVEIVEMLEEYWPTFIEAWPQIVEAAVMALAYVLIMVFRSKVTHINENLTAGFKQKMEEIGKMDVDLRNFTTTNSEDVKAVLDLAITKVNTAKDEYLAAHQDVRELYAKYERVERIMNIILEEVSNYDTPGNDTGVTEGSSGTEGRECEISTSDTADEQESTDADGDSELSGGDEDGEHERDVNDEDGAGDGHSDELVTGDTETSISDN